MSLENFPWSLAENETILWQGRPAPRCYTFRHWLQAAIGTVLFLACSFWLMIGIQLVYYQGHSWWLAVAPLLLVLGAFFIGPGQLALARLRWDEIFYALTDQRLLVRNKLIFCKSTTYQISDYKSHKQKKYGRHLLSIQLFFKGSAPVTLECLEHAELFLNHLPEKNRKSVSEKPV
ncbi:MAG: hypothetical protein DRH07_09075 [Deltaproteobacteria bacterium]|nr:MAG: hypothetical protein DRH07_09075 [Deltaproteobacteria bacterium]